MSKTITECHNNGLRKMEIPRNPQGQRHGIMRSWYDNGKLCSEVPYHQGKEHGVVKVWYNSGQFCYEHTYYKGQKHGISKGLCRDGRLNYERCYRNGQLHGLAKATGNMLFPGYEFYYLYGNLVTEKEYLEEEGRNNKPEVSAKTKCTCDINTLMISGCPSSSGGVCPN